MSLYVQLFPRDARPWKNNRAGLRLGKWTSQCALNLSALNFVKFQRNKRERYVKFFGTITILIQSLINFGINSSISLETRNANLINGIQKSWINVSNKMVIRGKFGHAARRLEIFRNNFSATRKRRLSFTAPHRHKLFNLPISLYGY